MAELTASPVPYHILTNPRWQIGGDAGGYGASLTFRVGAGVPGGSQADIFTFIDFVGGVEEFVTIGGVDTTRVVPLRHPFLPGMVAVALRAEGTGRPSVDAPGSTDAKIHVDFAVVPYGFDGSTPHMTLNRDYGAEAITLPGQAYAVGGTRLNHDVAVVMPIQHYTVTHYNVPTLDDSLFATLVGKVNNATFLDRAAGTWLFGGVRDQITRTIGGTLNRTVVVSTDMIQEALEKIYPAPALAAELKR